MTGRTRSLEPDDAMDRAAVVRALSSLRDTQSVWRPAEVTQEIAAALPTRLGSTAAELVERADRLASHAVDTLVVDVSRPIPDGGPLRRDGRPVTEGALDRLLTTSAILAEEERILEITQGWSDEDGADAQDIPADEDLTVVQRHVAGDRRLVLVVGPAGTGKTTAMRPAVARLHADGRPCFGVAPSAAAAEVLAVDTGIDADTLDKLLVEHRLERPPQHRYDLPAGSTVVVDEAAMVPTPRLAELIVLAKRRGWRLALVGDPMQFSAVGRSGMFGHLVDTVGAVELDRVHRFDASWERDASLRLRLRRGDTDVVGLYEQHGRLHGGTSRQMALATVHAWRDAIAAGESAAMMAPTREAVAVRNEIAQITRFAAGEVDPRSPSVQVGTSRAHVRDVVATRRNDRTLLTDRQRMVKNRDRWTVEAVHRNGSLTVDGSTGRVTLPAEYAAVDVELAYAETSHATQGRTVDRSFLYLDGPTGTSGIYVPLTRGRTTNEAFVVLHDERTAADVVAEAVVRTWVDQPATAVRLDRPTPIGEGAPTGQAGRPDPKTRPRREPIPEPELRALVRQAAAHQSAADTLRLRLDEHGRSLAALTRRKRELPELVGRAKAHLADATRTLDQHDRPLRRRGHMAEIARARNEVRSLPGHIEGLEREVENLSTTLQTERAARDQAVELHADRHGADAERVRQALDDDARIRGKQSVEKPARLLLDRLGPVPDEPMARDRWVAAAGARRATPCPLGSPRDHPRRPAAAARSTRLRDHLLRSQPSNRRPHETVGIPQPAQERSAPGLSL